MWKTAALPQLGPISFLICESYVRRLSISSSPWSRLCCPLCASYRRHSSDDIIQRKYPTVEAYKAIALSQGSDAPALQSVRFVQVPASTCFIPTICHPSFRLPADPGAHNLKGLLADLSHVPATEDVDEYSAPRSPPACVDGGGILHVFPNTCVRQQAWVVADERVPEDADDSDDEYLPPGWEEDHRVEHEKEGRQGCEWLSLNAYPDSETSSNSEGFLHVDEDGEHASEHGVEGDQSY